MRNRTVLKELRRRILERAVRQRPETSQDDGGGDGQPARVVSNGIREALEEWPTSFDRKLLPAAPTDVQRVVIPYVLGRESISVVSATGSGKTLSYVLPYVHLLSAEESRLLVVVPTRELVAQVAQTFRRFSSGSLEVVEITGEVGIDMQRIVVSRPFDIAVATPGRLRELLELRSVGGFEYVVVDEADRLMAGDFKEDMDAILEGMRPRAMGLFSATPFEYAGGTRIVVGEVSVSENVEEFFVYVEKEKKPGLLGEVLGSCGEWLEKNMGARLGEMQIKKVVVFCNSIKLCEELHRRFGESAVLHSKKTMGERRAAVKRMEEEGGVLIATDLGGRGIDIKEIGLVVNYELPKAIETYIHRCGRAGRQRRGMSLSLVCHEDRKMFPKLRRVIERRGGTVPGFMDVPEDVVVL